MTIYLKTNLLCVFGSLVLVQRWPDIRERMNQKGGKKNAASVSRPTFSSSVLHVSQRAGYLGLIVSHSEPSQYPSSAAKNCFARSASC